MARGGSKRGSYFFVIDAFLASAIFVLTLVLVISLFISQRPSVQSFLYASDYLSFLSRTQLRDFLAPEVQDLQDQGNITNLRKTIMEQVLIFHNQSRDDTAAYLLSSTVSNLPEQVSLNVSVQESDGTLSQLYGRGLTGVDRKATHLVVGRAGYALINDTALYGPVVLVVEVWS